MTSCFLSYAMELFQKEQILSLQNWTIKEEKNENDTHL